MEIHDAEAVPTRLEGGFRSANVMLADKRKRREKQRRR